MSGIFGGSKSKSTNLNRQPVTSVFSPLMGQAIDSNNRINNLIKGGRGELDDFKRATGFDFELFRGMDRLGSSAAGRGVFRSGARDKAALEFGNDLQNRFAQMYINTLLGQSNQALNAGQLVANAGQESTSSSTPGIGGFLGGLASGAASLGAKPFSDERLKTDIVKVGKTVDGLTVYQYRYKGEPEVYTGVMAQEVAVKKPEALGPEINGYMTVDYSKINVLDRE